MKLDLFGTEYDPSGAPFHRTRAAHGEPQFWLQEHIRDETDECIIWPFGKNNGGYGGIKIGNKEYKVTDVVCTIKYGPKPTPKHEAAHGPCNNPSCVNYRHLSWKTHQQNCLDRHRDGTMTSAKLNEDQIITIKQLYYQGGCSQNVIARQFGVSQSQIGRIVRGIRWTSSPKPDQTLKPNNSAGSKNGRAKLTDDNVLSIRRMHHKEGVPVKDIMKKFDMSKVQLCAILRGDSWQHLLPEPIGLDYFS